MTDYTLTVNGERCPVHGAWEGESLLYVLRERLGIMSPKAGCEEGECGSCSVIVDGVLVCSCLVLSAAAVDADIVTMEGVDAETVQHALVEEGGVQCGYCTPGLVMAIHDLLARRPDATVVETREALAGNLCRCTGYGRVLAAVHRAQAELAVS